MCEFGGGQPQFLQRCAVLADSESVDLINAIVSSNQQKLTSQIQFAAARQMLKAQDMEGAGALELLQAASGNGAKAADTLAVAASGLGGTLDTYA